MTFEPIYILDIVLIILLLMLAFTALHNKHLQQSIFLFIVFGLATTLIWLRLKAPDVALAEAAIGSGVAGALLLAALKDRHANSNSASIASSRPKWQILTTSYLVIGLGLTAAWAFIDARLNHDSPHIGLLVEQEIAMSGVSNPVTAVLLNFRAYDTLLELAVLFAALVGVMSIAPARPTPQKAGIVLNQLIGWLSPLLIITAAYLLWIGADSPGGAFQAGALLAAAGIIIRLSGKLNNLPSGIWLRLLSAGGLGIFLFVGLAVMANNNSMLQLPIQWNSSLILLIEIFATLSIAVSLLLVYLAGRPTAWDLNKEKTDV